MSKDEFDFDEEFQSEKDVEDALDSIVMILQEAMDNVEGM